MSVSDSEWEAMEVAEQLNAFAEAQRLREELAKTQLALSDSRIAVTEHLQTISKLTEELESWRSSKGAPMLNCYNCDSPLAPADRFEDGEWSWEDGKAYECSECSAKNRVAADDGRPAHLEEAEDEIDDDEADGYDLEQQGEW